jgi:hypothetical protein
MLSVVMLNVIMMNVVAPRKQLLVYEIAFYMKILVVNIFEQNAILYTNNCLHGAMTFIVMKINIKCFIIYFLHFAQIFIIFLS